MGGQTNGNERDGGTEARRTNLLMSSHSPLLLAEQSALARERNLYLPSRLGGQNHHESKTNLDTEVHYSRLYQA